VGFFTDSKYTNYYHGSVLIAHSRALPDNMKILLDKINNIFEADCNCILVNRYIDGSHIIPKHRDSMNHANVGVIILSYGDTRIFRIYDNNSNQICNLSFVHNQLIQMGGDFQREFLHDLKREPDKGERISFSFHKYTGLGLYK
jgi:alkylated DNA repair dioxygenase AlkB